MLKTYKIYCFEVRPRTEEQYIRDRDKLLKSIAKEKRNYNIDHNLKHKEKVIRLKFILQDLVSPLEYEVCKNTIEEFKKNYSHLIPEDEWDYDSLSDRYIQLTT